MKKKNLFSLILACVMTFVIMVPAFASDNNLSLTSSNTSTLFSYTLENNPDIEISVGEITGNIIRPRNRTYLNETFDAPTYSDEFTCSYSQGPSLRITFTNTGSSTYYVYATYDGTALSTVSVPAGSTRYITATNKNGEGLTAHIEFTINSDSSSNVKGTVVAVQGTNV